MKRFSLKRRLIEGDFENDLQTFSTPVNESVDEVAFVLSKSLITIVNQQEKRKK